MVEFLRPHDDGAAAHLPDLALPASDGSTVALAARQGWWVLYCYTLTGRPGVPLPPAWDSTPGAHGSTPQSETFRDRHAEFAALGVAILGLSTQDTAWQQEAATRLRLPYPLLSDTGLRLKAALDLPTFQAGSAQQFYKRLTLIVRDARIAHVFYPVFPPEGNAAEVLAWLRESGHMNP